MNIRIGLLVASVGYMLAAGVFFLLTIIPVKDMPSAAVAYIDWMLQQRSFSETYWLQLVGVISVAGSVLTAAAMPFEVRYSGWIFMVFLLTSIMAQTLFPFPMIVTPLQSLSDTVGGLCAGFLVGGWWLRKLNR